jgi:hypothetical protein
VDEAMGGERRERHLTATALHGQPSIDHGELTLG